MMRVQLAREDGLADRSWLQSVVTRAQLGLVGAGQGLQADGKFGRDTEAAVRAFQASAGIPESGLVDRATWEALSPHIESALAERTAVITRELPGFRGDLEWVHLQEGHHGVPFWPGGGSGVTLDPGIDLGQADAAVIELYRPLVSPAQFEAMQSAVGARGDTARAALDGDAVLSSIRLDRSQAVDLLPFAAGPYWADIGRRFAPLRQADTIGSVQTALLSLAYNRGDRNTELATLGAPLDAGHWSEVADRIAAMQQDHAQAGVARRRREEAFIIRTELEYLRS